MRFWWACVLLLLVACKESSAPPQALNIGEILGRGETEGFARADTIVPFHFPADHGPHPSFRNEWWYLTGNVRTTQGRRFGYQVTFFRNALSAQSVATDGSAWRTNALWMAHVALTDVQDGHHYGEERFSP